MSQKCTIVTFKRKSKHGPVLPKSKWRTIKRCAGKTLSSAAKRTFKKRRVCRRGGSGPLAHLFVACSKKR